MGLSAPGVIETVAAALPLPGLSIGGLVMLILTAWFREWIYPRGYVTALREDHAQLIEALREDRDKRISELVADRAERIAEYQAEVADWREAYRGMEIAVATVRGQNGELLELARTSEHVLRSLPVPPASPTQSGGEH